MGKTLLLFWFVFFSFCSRATCQEMNSLTCYKALIGIENNQEDEKKKAYQANLLKGQMERAGITQDSVFARLLHKLGVWLFYGKNDAATAIAYTREAIRINSVPQKNTSHCFTSKSYFNLGVYYHSSFQYTDALAVLDSAVTIEKNCQENEIGFEALYLRLKILFALGLFQKALDVANHAIDSSLMGPVETAQLLLEKSFSESVLGYSSEVLKTLDKAILYVGNQKVGNDILADLFKAKAFAFEQLGNIAEAKKFYASSLKHRRAYADPLALADNYSDIGVFYYKKVRDFNAASNYFDKAFQIVDVHPNVQTTLNLNINISDLFLASGVPDSALSRCQKGLNLLFPNLQNDQTDLPNLKEIVESANAFSVFPLLSNAAEAVLAAEKDSKKLNRIFFGLKMCRINDSLVNFLRNRQPDLSTKLFWSVKTRGFYEVAISLAYLANDSESLFYFMEKSRAVLLNDKLSELGSMAFLPKAAAEKEQEMKLIIRQFEDRMKSLLPGDTAMATVVNELSAARIQLDKFISSLESQYPVYYQYKYNTSVPSITELRARMLESNQSYLSFFETDSLVYTLLVTREEIRFNRILFPGYADSIKVFTGLCKNRQMLNRQYSRYTRLGYQLYKELIAPMNLPAGRVIVSPDLNFVPLDALLQDTGGKHFLLYDYVFSYTYSAGYLMKLADLKPSQPLVGFMGIAPERFSSRLSLAVLNGSVASIESIGQHYAERRLLKYQEATRQYFLQHAGSYGLLHLYAHARADSVGEPLLYMSDSAIAVSELQRWRHSNVGLAFLAACETGSGELYIGEGVNSIARSFAAVGVPATIATLWTADNKAMYRLSERFYHYLNKGLSKDTALQMAKIDFLKEGSGEDALPFYWASLVLSGDSHPVQSPYADSTITIVLSLLGVLLAATLVSGRVRKRIFRGI